MSLSLAETKNLGGPRDLRIDLFRGLALYMMFVDHVRDNPLAHFTYHRLGFSDAAEIFIFLSGLGCGIAYFRMLAAGGYAALFAAVSRRTIRICAFYWLVGAVTIALMVALNATALWRIGQHFNEIDPSLGAIARDPVGALLDTLLLMSPSLAGILVIYILFTLIVVPLFLIGARYSAAATLAASGLVWLVSQAIPHSLLPAAIYNRMAFDPLAWQFLFAIGMFFGTTYNLPATRQPTCLGRLLPLAWAVVVGCVLYKVVLRIAPNFGFDVAWLRLPSATLDHMKKELSPLRLIHFLSVALLVATYFKPDNFILRMPILSPLIRTGRRSIEVFCLSVVLAYVVEIVLFTTQPSISVILILNGLAFAAMALTAMTLTRELSHQAAPNERQSLAKTEK